MTWLKVALIAVPIVGIVLLVGLVWRCRVQDGVDSGPDPDPHVEGWLP